MFFLGDPTERGAWWATVHWAGKSQTGLSYTITAKILVVFVFLFFQSVITKYLHESDVKELCSPGASRQILVILITDLEFTLPSDLGSKEDINTTSQLNFIVQQQKHLLLNYASIKLLEKCLGFGPFPYIRPDVCQEQGRSASVQT